MLRSSGCAGARTWSRVWDGLTLLHEVEGEATTSWIWLDGELVGTLQGGRRHAVLTDPIGVVSQVVGEDGSLSWRGGVDCFGAGWRELEQVRQPWRFPGHLEDEDTGLAMSLWRAFDPEAAQYLSPCPLGIAAGIRPYAYVRDPLSETSPLGLGPGLDPYYGPELRACGEALHVALALDALDRRDGAAGPRARFEPQALLPDPLDLEWGAWSRHHPARALDR
ncbi:MAG: RHS repeat-associated core domain-containing protein [Sandaracinaceae bacterium]|nr:RHS repeat-associated core domain-containing protein [Sandaracinaceae bacterium]